MQVGNIGYKSKKGVLLATAAIVVEGRTTRLKRGEEAFILMSLANSE